MRDNLRKDTTHMKSSKPRRFKMFAIWRLNSNYYEAFGKKANSLLAYIGHILTALSVPAYTGYINSLGKGFLKVYVCMFFLQPFLESPLFRSFTYRTKYLKIKGFHLKPLKTGSPLMQNANWYVYTNVFLNFIHFFNHDRLVVTLDINL